MNGPLPKTRIYFSSAIVDCFVYNSMNLGVQIKNITVQWYNFYSLKYSKYNVHWTILLGYVPTLDSKIDVGPEKFRKKNKCRALTDKNLILGELPCWEKIRLNMKRKTWKNSKIDKCLEKKFVDSNNL